MDSFSPRLEQLFAEAGGLAAASSLKDSVLLVSAHHASTLQQLQRREQQVNEGNFV